MSSVLDMQFNANSVSNPPSPALEREGEGEGGKEAQSRADGSTKCSIFYVNRRYFRRIASREQGMWMGVGARRGMEG